MSFGVYRYDHSQFGPIMLLLDSQTPKKSQSTIVQQSNQGYGSRLEGHAQGSPKSGVKEKRGHSYRISPSVYNTNDRSMDKNKFGSQRKSLEKYRKIEQKSIQLPMIPKSKKKKIQI